MRADSIRRLVALAAAVGLVATACPGGDEPPEPAEQLTRLAYDADDLAYAASYRYTLTGDLAEAVDTTMEIVQEPPTVVRKIATTTNTAEGESISIPQWLIQRDDESYACTRYESEGIRCVDTPGTPGMFGFARVDEIFDLTRDPDGFAAVESSEGQQIAGEQATCFAARNHTATPPPEQSPEIFTPRAFRFELCYASDGILLRARRVVAEEVPPELEGRQESVLEATSVRRSFTPEELELPDAVAEVAQLEGVTEEDA